MTRLNKHLAFALGVSRREADELISRGEVAINNTVAQLGSQLRPNDSITVKGKVVDTPKQYTYLALNKPSGFVSSRAQQGKTPTIYSLLPKEFHSLKPVGRLDKDSSGLLLLTNDGDFAHSMTHPSFSKTKVYLVTLDKDLAPLHQQIINDIGIQLEDGTSKFNLEKQDDHHRKNWRITMSEGRNRQIRRTFAALDYTVKKLHRTQFGRYDLTSLAIKRGGYTKIEHTTSST